MREWLHAIPDDRVPEGKILLLNDAHEILGIIEIGRDVPDGDDIAFVCINPKNLLEMAQFSAAGATKH